jgi:hypothetical protein
MSQPDSVVSVQYSIMKGWSIIEAHAWAGQVLDYPSTKTGSPALGKFPAVGECPVELEKQDYTLKVELKENVQCGKDKASADLYMLAHATVVRLDEKGAVVQKETAWSEGDPCLITGSWATYSTLPVTCNCT